jgi:hypothetical protein
MPKSYEHRVCDSVLDRVTFANGDWQGEPCPESERRREHVETCPLVWDSLRDAGAEGWRLVHVLETPSADPRQPWVRTMHLLREFD